MNKITLPLLFVAGLFLSSNAMAFCPPGVPFNCEDDGVQGPEGPQGDTGPQGPQGDQGVPGEDGDPTVLFEDDRFIEVDNRSTTNRVDITDLRSRQERDRQVAQQNSQAISDLNSKVNRLDTRLSAGIASAIAMANHQFDTTYRGLQGSLALGKYRDGSAISISFGGAVTNRIFLNGSASRNNRQDEAYSMGGTFKF